MLKLSLVIGTLSSKPNASKAQTPDNEAGEEKKKEVFEYFFTTRGSQAEVRGVYLTYTSTPSAQDKEAGEEKTKKKGAFLLLGGPHAPPYR